MTTLEAQHEVITNLILENQKLKQERDEAREEWGKASMDAAKLLSEKTKVMGERDEAREAVRLASIEAKALATSIQKSEYSDVKFELCDSVAGVISQIDNMYAGVREQRDEAREKYATEATEHMLSVNKLCNERDDLREALMAIEDRCVDCEDACDDIQKIRDIARAALEK